MRVKVQVIHDGQNYVGEIQLHRGDATITPLHPQKTDVLSTREIVTKPSEAIDMLYRKGFFRESRKLADVFDELRKQGYNFSRQSIFMALKAASFLVVSGRRGSYAYAQKFPAQP